MPATPEVIYPETPHGKIEVFKLADPSLVEEDHAMALLCLLNSSFSRTYERPRGFAPEGFFRSYFDPQDRGKVTRRREKMKQSIEDGAVYLFTKGRELNELPWSGVLKSRLIDSNEGAATDAPKVVVIEDILAVPRSKGRGSALMHTLVTYSGLEDDYAVRTRIFTDNHRANDWYSSLGFEFVQPMPSTAFGKAAPRASAAYGQIILERALCQTPAGGVASIRKELEKPQPEDKPRPSSGPWLAQAWLKTPEANKSQPDA